MTEKEMDKEHLQEELESEIHDEKSNETQPVTDDNANPEENPSESAPEPEPHPQENNGEVTLRDVVEVLKKGFSSISKKLDEGFSTLSGKLDTVSGKLDTVSGKLNSIEGVLKGIKSSIGMLRGEISEWALLDTIVDYLKEHEKEGEFIIRKVPRADRKGADWILETKKRYYIVETKTYLDNKILKKALEQIGNEAKKLEGKKEIWGIVAARFSEIRSDKPIMLRFKRGKSIKTVPVFIFTYDMGAEKFRFLNKG